MYVREFMTRKLITVTSDTPIARAARLLSTYKIRRLPVVDEGRLVGIVGEKMIAAALPTAATTLGGREMADTMSRMTVRSIMNKEVVTVTPDTTVETSLAVAQENRVGSLLVVNEKGELVGIVTTNDVVYGILNPLLGIRKPGTRIHIHDCLTSCQVAQVTALIDKNRLEIETLHIDECAERNSRDLIVQVNTNDPCDLIRDLQKAGFRVAIRHRKYWPLPAIESQPAGPQLSVDGAIAPAACRRA